MNNINYTFACNGCGRCCNDSPVLLLSENEIMKYSKYFLLNISIIIENKKKYMAKNNTKQSMQFYKNAYETRHTIRRYKGSNLEYSFGVFVAGDGFHLKDKNNKGYCIAKNITTNECTIHGHKPQMCKTIPFQAGQQEEWQDLILDDFKSNYNCINVPNGNNVFYKGKINNEEFKINYDLMRSGMKKDLVLTDIFVEKLIAHETSVDNLDELLLSISTDYNKTVRLSLPITEYLITDTTTNNGIKRKIIEDQLILLEKYKTNFQYMFYDYYSLINIYKEYVKNII